MLMKYFFHLLVVLILGTSVLWGCGEKVKVETRKQPSLVVWDLPQDWVEASNQTIGFKDLFTIAGTGKLGDFKVNVQFFADEKSLLEQVNLCRDEIDLVNVKTLEFNSEDEIELSAGRLINLASSNVERIMHSRGRAQLTGQGNTFYVLQNKSVDESGKKKSHLYLSWVGYPGGRYILTWFSGGADQFWDEFKTVFDFSNSFEFPRLTYTQRQTLAFTEESIASSNQASIDHFKKLATLRAASREARGLSSPGFVHGPNDGHDHGPAVSPKARPSSGKTVTAKGDPKWVLPKGWIEQPQSMFGYKKFFVGGDKNLQVKISRMGVNFGGMKSNLNRWHGEVGLGAIKSLSEVKFTKGNAAGVESTIYRFDGPGVGGVGKMTSHVVMYVHSNRTWFYKLIGPSDGVEKTKVAFDGWLQSITH